LCFAVVLVVVFCVWCAGRLRATTKAVLSQGGLLAQSCGVDFPHGLPGGASDKSPPRGFAAPCSARTRNGVVTPHEKTRKIGLPVSFHIHHSAPKTLIGNEPLP